MRAPTFLSVGCCPGCPGVIDSRSVINKPKITRVHRPTTSLSLHLMSRRDNAHLMTN